MGAPRGRNGLRIAALAGWLLLSGAFAAAASGQDTAVAPPLRAPVLLFISGSSSADLPDPVAEVRGRAVANLEAALVASGLDVVPGDDLLPHLMARRVRSAYSLSPAFLADLSRETGASHLLVAVLLVHQQRLQLLARLIHLTSASVVWAWQGEAALVRPDLLRGGIDAAGWYAGLGDVCTRCRPVVTLDAPSGGLPLVVLPVRGLGCDPDLALAATHSVLAPIAAAHRWRVVDPGVAASLLQDEGVRLDRINANGRHRLARDLGVRLLAAPELMVYAAGGRGAGVMAGGADAVAIDAGIDEYELAIRFLDTESGAVVANFVNHQDNTGRVGWFGIIDDTSVLERLGTAAQALWNEVDDNLEER